MGQWLSQDARGNIYLVEDVEDVMSLEVSQPEHFAFTTQTTLSVDETRDVIAALRTRFPKIVGPRHDDICYATQNRQDAVRELAGKCDLVFVVGSVNSSNSNRLRELAEKNGARAYLIDGAEEIRPEWLEGAVRIGVTAGASAPEVLVQGVISHLQQLGGGEITEIEGEPEDMVFALPKELRITLVD
jgi:4-hydroxy-3-methylbut-2-enyl diphosphate reductase